MNPEIVLEVLDKRKSLHIEDPAIYIHWEVLTRLLSESEEDTIKLLLSCSEENVSFLSEIFEDIAYNLQSKKFIDCLDVLYRKFPNIPIAESIKSAKEIMD